MNTDSFIVYINTDDIYKDNAEDVETSFDYQLDRPLPKAKKSESNWINEKWISCEINDKICWIKTKTCSSLTDDGFEEKKAKGTKNCLTKTKLIFENYTNCWEATQLENKINHLERNKTDIDSLEKDHKEFVRNNKSILKA